MINRPSPVALLLQASESSRLRRGEYDGALFSAIRKFQGNIVEAREAPEICEARRAVVDAEDAYAAQACRVLEESKLVVSTIEEIEALLQILRNAVPPLAVAAVEVQGPSVAAMRSALEGQGFILWNGNRYTLPQNFLPAADAAAPPVTPVLASVPAQQQEVRHRGDFGGVRRGGREVVVFGVSLFIVIPYDDESSFPFKKGISWGAVVYVDY